MQAAQDAVAPSCDNPLCIPEEKLWTYVLVRGSLGKDPVKRAERAIQAARLSMLGDIHDHPVRASEILHLNWSGRFDVLNARSRMQLQKASEDLVRAGLSRAIFAGSGGTIPLHFDTSQITAALAAGPTPKEMTAYIFTRSSCVP
jgi:hypothetical protein